jgi:hypothetical protein
MGIGPTLLSVKTADRRRYDLAERSTGAVGRESSEREGEREKDSAETGRRVPRL